MDRIIKNSELVKKISKNKTVNSIKNNTVYKIIKESTFAKIILFFLLLLLIWGLFSLSQCKGEEIVNPYGPKYEVNLEFKCFQNLIFSKYDIDVSIDNKQITTIKHGDTDSFNGELTEGTHKLRFKKSGNSSPVAEEDLEVSENTPKWKYYLGCNADYIDVWKINLTEQEENEKKEQEERWKKEQEEKSRKEELEKKQEELDKTLTVENCPALAEILACTDTNDPKIHAFASNYAGRKIEFDGNVSALSNYKDYTTRWNVLLNGGNFNPEHSLGPDFQFFNVTMSSWAKTDLFVGKNVHIIAKVKNFDYDTCLFQLEPVTVRER